MNLSINNKGKWSDTDKFLKALTKITVDDVLKKYGQMGVDALIKASPTDSGLLAESWSYKIEKDKKGNKILEWHNSDIENGYSVAFLVQYGHGTASGTFVEGKDFINPAIKPVMDQIVKDIIEEVNRL